jgi:hypothetical protein
MTKQKQSQRPAAKPRYQIRINFTLDRESFEGQMFSVAAKHYLANMPIVSQATADRVFACVGKLIIKDWLERRVSFHSIEMGPTRYPLPTEKMEPPDDLR